MVNTLHLKMIKVVALKCDYSQYILVLMNVKCIGIPVSVPPVTRAPGSRFR